MTKGRELTAEGFACKEGDATSPQDEVCGRGVTRRSFIKFGGVGAMTLALAPGTIGALAGCRSKAGDEFFRGERTVIDHADRELIIPTVDKLERIYYTSGLGQIYVFSLEPELQGGSAYQFTSGELEYLPEGTEKLLYMGSLAGGGQIDREMLVAEDIQLVFSISGVPLTAANISEADDLQHATGIPVVLVDGSFTNVMNAYRFVGDIMGRTDRGVEIAEYLEQIYGDVKEAVADVADGDRVSLYYAEGPFGLSTEPDVSQHAQTFVEARARNVAEVPLSSSGYGMSAVSLESVIQWDPEVIIAWDAKIRGGADEIIRTNSDWAVIKAVQDGRVYTMPNAPFAWCDRPPGVNRFLGLQWVANMLYPDRYDVDMVEEVKKFYSLLYWVDITDEQAKSLLGNSYPPYGKN